MIKKGRYQSKILRSVHFGQNVLSGFFKKDPRAAQKLGLNSLFLEQAKKQDQKAVLWSGTEKRLGLPG